MNYKLLFLIILTLLIQVIILIFKIILLLFCIIIIIYKEQNCSQVCTYYIRSFNYSISNSTICEYWCCIDTTETITLDAVCCFPRDSTWPVWIYSLLVLLLLFVNCIICVPFCFFCWRSNYIFSFFFFILLSLYYNY